MTDFERGKLALMITHLELQQRLDVVDIEWLINLIDRQDRKLQELTELEIKRLRLIEEFERGGG